jgi:type II secretory pathway pseudopilin PulG
MKNRHGQALIIVVIIIAVIMAVFANSLTTQLRYHAQEETEIYQREQALYLAEMGINQMIFNINNGTTYNDGDTITGNFSDIGNYTATYHTPDDSGFGGSSYIESAGTVGKFTRKVFVSVQSGGSTDAFKYCLFTLTGGNDGVDDANFYNPIWKVPTEYKYNLPPGSVTPYPDPAFYNHKKASDNFDEYINYAAKVGTILTVLAAIYEIINFMVVDPRWTNLILKGSPISWMYWGWLILGIVIPFILFLSKKKGAILIGAISAVIGTYLMRSSFVFGGSIVPMTERVPGLGYQAYSIYGLDALKPYVFTPSHNMEWMIIIGCFGIGIAIFTILDKLFDIRNVTDLYEHH